MIPLVRLRRLSLKLAKQVSLAHRHVPVQPSNDPQDPYNWSSWIKHALLIQIAFHAMMGAALLFHRSCA